MNTRTATPPCRAAQIVQNILSIGMKSQFSKGSRTVAIIPSSENPVAKETATVALSKHLARPARVLYLTVPILAGFAIGFVPLKVYVVGDAGTTAQNIAANEDLFRLGFLADLTHSAFMHAAGRYDLVLALPSRQ